MYLSCFEDDTLEIRIKALKKALETVKNTFTNHTEFKILMPVIGQSLGIDSSVFFDLVKTIFKNFNNVFVVTKI